MDVLVLRNPKHHEGCEVHAKTTLVSTLDYYIGWSLREDL